MPAAKAKKAAPAKGKENVDPQHKPQSSNPRVAALTDHGEGVTPRAATYGEEKGGKR